MNQHSTDVLLALMRSGVALTISAAIVAIVLHVGKIASPTLRRVAYVTVLLQGCMVVQWRIAVPAGFSPAPVPGFGDHFPGGVAAESIPQSESPLAVPTGRELEIGGRLVPEAAASTVERIPWPTWVVLAWGSGMIILCARAAWSYVLFVRHTPAPLAADGPWVAEWEALQQQEDIRRRVTLHVAENLGPMLCRFPRGYRLIVPADLWRRLRPPQRRAILRHELAHLERHDVWKSLAVRVMALPHWFNPLAWWVVREFDACAECACDEAVRKEAPDRVADYARALVQLAESARGSLLLRSGARGGGLADRVRRLLQPASWEDSTMKKTVLFSLLAGLTLIGLVQIRLVADEPRAGAASDRSATSTPRRRHSERAADRSPGREAVIDVAYLFHNLDEFERAKEKLKAEMEREKKSLQTASEELAKLNRSLNDADDSQARELLEKEIARKTAEIEAGRTLATKLLRQREAEIYQKTYDRISAEVAQYAKEHRIRIVRRADLSAQREKQSAPTSDPQEIIRRMNQEIVYIERDELDITDAIFLRLKSSDAPADEIRK